VVELLASAIRCDESPKTEQDVHRIVEEVVASPDRVTAPA
jgi:hypothetical protein